MRNLPFRDVVPNNAWFQLVLCAMDLIAWTKALCLNGELAIAEPKRLCSAFLHCAGRIVRGARRVTVSHPGGLALARRARHGVHECARHRALPNQHLHHRRRRACVQRRPSAALQEHKRVARGSLLPRTHTSTDLGLPKYT
jgi:hypothetical protein